jgi:DNA-binding transcriptional LysR family regulator
MELRQLEYLVVIAEERHFTRAAQRLNVAQPTLSHQIRRLELELGIPLVNRTTRRVSMTDSGDRIVRRARRVLSEIQAVQADAEAARGLRAGKVTIGLTPAPGAFDLPSLLSAFASIAPDVELSVREHLSPVLADWLQSDALDIAFVTSLDEGDREGLELHAIAREPLVAIVGPEHHLIHKGHVDMAELRDERYVAPLPGATIRAQVERAARSVGYTPTIAYEAGEVSRTRAIVAAGLGIAILPRSDALSPGPVVTVLALDGQGLTHEIHVAWRSGKRPTPAAQSFKELVARRFSGD